MNRRTVIVASLVSLVGIAFVGYLAFERFESEARTVDDGVVASKRGDYKKALEILMPYAKRGNKLAQETVGVAYAFGQGVSRDRQRARELLRDALAEDAAETYLWIAKSFESGDGVARDPEEAAWYRIAAEERSIDARARLDEDRRSPPSSP